MVEKSHFLINYYVIYIERKIQVFDIKMFVIKYPNRMFPREATKNGKGYIADMYEMYIYGSYLRMFIQKKREKILVAPRSQ